MNSKSVLALMGAALTALLLPAVSNALQHLLFIVMNSNDVSVGAVIEEMLKASLLLIATTFIKKPTIAEGTFFGGVIGLAYGLSENFLFVLFLAGSPETTSIQLFRNAFTLTMHAATGGLLGLFLAKSGLSNQPAYFVIGFALAALIHIVFNLTVMNF